MYNNSNKKVVAVFFGAKSPEHDVSIITGLQAIKALDPTKYQSLPVYISPNGDWFVGEELLDPANYMLNNILQNKLTKVVLDLSNNPRGRLIAKNCGIFNRFKTIEFDIGLLALHGMHGEDGQAAALMELANIPYTGMRHFGATLAMNKVATKRILKAAGVPVLPDQVIMRPTSGFMVQEDILKKSVENFSFPICVKPCNLGSSIGVARVNDIEELAAVLPNIFQYDQIAMLEPFIENLVEYNISVGYIENKLSTSAIEKPKCNGDLLDFKQKYLSSNNSSNQFGCKSATISSGMLNMTRELNPVLDPASEQNLHNWAKAAFVAMYGSGFPRIDFACNYKTGEIWLNEINPCPGSFGFYLWEASQHKLLFTELLNILISEALILHNNHQLPLDPTPKEARLFSRK